MRKPWLATLLLSSLLLCLLCGCCRLRKGIVLRGDWSIELNRVPHLAGHGPHYACTSDCPTCPACSPLPAPPPGSAEPPEAIPVPPETAGTAVRSRFLPVPIRPAFQPAHSAPPDALAGQPFDDSEAVELPPPQGQRDAASDDIEPMPPQPNELHLRPLSTARPLAAPESDPNSGCRATAHTARSAANPQKGRHARMRPHSRL